MCIVIINRWVPVFADPEQNIGVMSIAFLLDKQTDAVVWRGPKKNGTSYKQKHVNAY